MTLRAANDDAERRATFRWWSSVVHRSSLLRDLLRRAVRWWNVDGEPRVVEASPGMGIWFVPIRLAARSGLHRHHGMSYLVVVVASESLVSEGVRSEALAALCGSAGVGDVRLALTRVHSLPAASERDVGRLACLARFLWQDALHITSESQAIESTGRQLAESYEEISLLHSIVETMTAPGMQQPERFLRLACEQLLATLPYRWVGVMIVERFETEARRHEGTEAQRHEGTAGTATLRVANDDAERRATANVHTSKVNAQQTTNNEQHKSTSQQVNKSKDNKQQTTNSKQRTTNNEQRTADQTLHLTLGTQSVKHFLVVGECGASSHRMRALVGRLLGAASADAPLILEPGKTACRAGVKAADFEPLGKSVLVHPLTRASQRKDVIGVVVAGEKYGQDPSVSNVDIKLLGAVASHMAIFLENAALYGDLNSMFLGTLEALTASIDAKDRYTCGHSRRVALLTQQLARAVGMDESTVKRMHIAGLVHDVGKIGVPEALLMKPGRLTDEEFAWIKKHPEMGYRILKDIPQLQDILPGVLYHHERWDGGGYPQGLTGREIPPVARLIGLADAFDAMSSSRTYRAPMKREDVLDEILRCAGTQFDPELAAAFVRLDFRGYDRLVREHRKGDQLEIGKQKASVPRRRCA